MTRPTALFRTANSAVTAGSAPLVVGVISSLDAPVAPSALCDLIEVRLDKTSCPADWLQRSQAIEAAGKPVLLTARLRNEGGEWKADDDARLQVYRQAVRGLAAVDIELSSAICQTVAQEAEQLQKICIVSYHHFEKTPSLSELDRKSVV